MSTYSIETERMRNEYAEKSEYENALACINKIRDLKSLIQEKKKKDLEYLQCTQLDNLEAEYKQEMERAASDWDMKIAEIEEKYQKGEEALNEKHMTEMDTMYTSLEQKLEQKFKYSKDYLELETQEHQLAKFLRYKEAIIVKKQKELQRQRDIDKWNNEKNDKIKLEAIAKSNRHLIEKEAFKGKNEFELELLKKNKMDDIKKIQKKYQNKKLDLDIQMRIERMANDKSYISKMGRLKKLHYLNTIHNHNSSNTNLDEQNNNMAGQYSHDEDFNDKEEENYNNQQSNDNVTNHNEEDR